MKNVVFVILLSLLTSLGLSWTVSPNHQPVQYSTMGCGGNEGSGEFCAQ